jgi:hypothetical protein
MLELLSVLVLAACHRQPPAPTPSHGGATPRMLVYAPTTGQSASAQQSPELPESPPAPTAAYPSLAAACDLVQQAMTERLQVSVARADSVGFENEFVAARRTGCGLKASGTFARARADTTTPSRDSEGDLAAVLAAAGWADIPRYTADGPDGSIAGMRSRETVCIFTWRWDGGDDSDSTYVPSDKWDLVAHCARHEPGDSV